MSPTEQHQSTTQTPPHAASRSSDTNSAAQPRLSSRTSITDCKLGWFKRRYWWSFESSLVCVCVCVCVLLGDQEVGSPRPQAGHGVVWFPRRRLSLASPAADGGGDAAAEAGLHLHRLAVRWAGPETERERVGPAQNTPKTKSTSSYQSTSFTADQSRSVWKSRVVKRVRKLNNMNSRWSSRRRRHPLHQPSLQTVDDSVIVSFRSDQTGCWVPISRLMYRKTNIISDCL